MKSLIPIILHDNIIESELKFYANDQTLPSSTENGKVSSIIQGAFFFFTNENKFRLFAIDLCFN